VPITAAIVKPPEGNSSRFDVSEPLEPSRAGLSPMVGSMRRILLRVGVGLLVVITAGALACSFLLPERYAINAPLRHLLWGVPGTPPDAEAVGGLSAPGLFVGIYAEVANARWMRLTPAGDLLVTTPRDGSIVWLGRDANRDGRPDGQRILLDGLNRPHGLELHDGWLYVGETDAVARIRFDVETGHVEGELERIVTGLPAEGSHWTRTVRIGPDGWLYVSVGSSCNVCEEEDGRRAAMLRFRPDGTEGEVFATGLRNSVGFDWRPGTNELYATDNGRDLLGDDFPPCELNRVVRGGFYGWPYANGERIPDPDFGAGHAREIDSSIPPAHGFRAHTAPLGITFVRHAAPGSALEGAALVALHGSWNRTRKDGYEVVALHWDEDGSIREEPFFTGFLNDDRAIGRPVDVVEAPGGAFYVSDDYAGVIYRLSPERATGGGTPGRVEPSAPIDPLASLSAEERTTSAARGAALYEQHACFTCHEAERAAEGVVAAPLNALAERYSLDQLTLYLATPTPPMPVFPLTGSQRRDLAVQLLNSPAD